MACCLVYDRMSLFLRNWNNPIKTMPSSFVYVTMSSPTITALRNESSIFLSEVIYRLALLP